MIKDGTVVKITKGRYIGKTGVVCQILEEGEFDDETIITVQFHGNHKGQFKESELMEIAQGGEII